MYYSEPLSKPDLPVRYREVNPAHHHHRATFRDDRYPTGKGRIPPAAAEQHQESGLDHPQEEAVQNERPDGQDRDKFAVEVAHVEPQTMAIAAILFLTYSVPPQRPSRITLSILTWVIR